MSIHAIKLPSGENKDSTEYAMLVTRRHFDNSPVESADQRVKDMFLMLYVIRVRFSGVIAAGEK
jgi:hypothetical protein